MIWVNYCVGYGSVPPEESVHAYIFQEDCTPETYGFHTDTALLFWIAPKRHFFLVVTSKVSFIVRLLFNCVCDLK